MDFNQYAAVSIKQVENGFVVRFEPGYLKSKEYITVTFEEAKRTALRLLSEIVHPEEDIFAVNKEECHEDCNKCECCDEIEEDL